MEKNSKKGSNQNRCRILPVKKIYIFLKTLPRPIYENLFTPSVPFHSSSLLSFTGSRNLFTLISLPSCIPPLELKTIHYKAKCCKMNLFELSDLWKKKLHFVCLRTRGPSRKPLFPIPHGREKVEKASGVEKGGGNQKKTRLVLKTEKIKEIQSEEETEDGQRQKN